MAHGARVAEAATEPKENKPPKKELRGIELRKSANGGIIAEHNYNVYDGMNKPHTFSGDEGHLLAAHIEKHLGLKMPGRAEGTVAAPSDGEARE
jgi:hypothetical protein